MHLVLLHFSTAALTTTNNGQTLRITGIIITNPTPSCSQSFSQDVTLSVSPTSVGGSISGGGATVCASSNSGTLTLSGNTGNVIRWESSPNGTTWTTINNTSTSLAV
jgi:hypothetical protein